MASDDEKTGATSKAYEKAKRLARDGGLEARRELARNNATKKEILYFLAGDPDPSVRREAAKNKETPRHADLLLAQDDDVSVRSDLATKIARLTPGLSPEQQGTLYQITLETLEVLVRDQMVQVRTILSEALKDVANAPPSVIRRLARDTEISVSGPVLEFSPVLSDDDLIEIISSATVQGALSAISRRQQLHEPVSDAIAYSGDQDAVAELLSNQSAQIREDTLNRIVDGAAPIENWHAPLVRRPGLPAGASRKIAGFVAESLLTELRDRRDLSADAIAAVTEVVEAKLGRLPGDDQHDEEMAGQQDTEDDESFTTRRVRAMIERDELTEDEVFEALQGGDRLFAVAALAIRADLPESLVHHAIQLRSAKGIVSITRKAGFSMHLASTLQLRLASIPPKAILKANSDGDYPIDDAAMDWQLEFLVGSQK
jgi:uncharacterized protein (DUF2336 family)